MQELVDVLTQRNITISSCESFTGGLFASTITSIAGVSNVFKGSIVAYQNDIKKDILNISEHIFTNYGVISDKMALEMAIKTKKMFNTNICVSFTGNAGPSNLENKKIGLWYMAVCFNELSFVYEFNDNNPRNIMRENAVIKAEQIILNIIRNN